MSPLLFIIVLDFVLQRTNMEAPEGIRWNLAGTLNDLDYADDLVLMAARFSAAQSQLSALQRNAAKAGLKINIKKTKLMRIATQCTRPLLLDGSAIDEVIDFCYLGATVTNSGGTIEDVGNRINRARVAFYKLNRTWKDRHISQKLKLRIFDACVVSVLLYGCETWSMTRNCTQQIQTFVNKGLRRILQVWWPDKISNVELWRRTEHIPIDKEIKKRKWRWIGHTLRKEEMDIVRQALDWNHQGARKRGRPRTTWRRVVAKEAEEQGKSWREIKQLAQDRAAWKAFVYVLSESN